MAKPAIALFIDESARSGKRISTTSAGPGARRGWSGPVSGGADSACGISMTPLTRGSTEPPRHSSSLVKPTIRRELSLSETAPTYCLGIHNSAPLFALTTCTSAQEPVPSSHSFGAAFRMAG